MRRLYLLRHAKSSWDDPYISDFDRPLNQRGYREAEEMAHYMIEKGYVPDVILCSPARRAVETLAPLIEILDPEPETVFLDNIYECSWLTLQQVVEEREEDSVMLIGHCPGIESYLSELLQENMTMKTCQLAVLDLKPVRLVDFVRPKEF